MGVLIDLHEVSPFKDEPTPRLIARYNKLTCHGMTRAAHPIVVELYWRRVKRSTTNPDAS
jgi:hypothetical protein